MPESGGTASVYRNGRIQNPVWGDKVFELIRKQFGLLQAEGRRVDGSNRVYPLRDDKGAEYDFSHSLSDGSWTLSKNIISDPMQQEDALALQGETLQKWMTDNGLMPKEAVFSLQGDNTLRWDASAPADLRGRAAGFASGVILAEAAAGNPVPQWLFYTMASLDFVREVAIISPGEAFEQVKKENFQQYNDLEEGFVLIVSSYSLDYVYDTKGFYRPGYRFEGTLDGEAWSCMIPAA